MLSPRCPSVCPLAISLPLCNSCDTLEGFRRNLTQMFTRLRRRAEAMFRIHSFTFGPCIETRDVEATVSSVQQRPDVVIVFIYKSPKVSCMALVDLLQQIQTKYVKSTKAVLLGDFNIDWTSESFEKHALEKLTNCTLDKQSKGQLLITTQQSTSSSLTSKHTNVE